MPPVGVGRWSDEPDLLANGTVSQRIIGTGRGGRLHGRLWTGSGEIQGVVIVVHGLGEHGGRYRELAEDLAQSGWGVFAFDLSGHGRSPGVRGRIDRYDGMLADIAWARQTVAMEITGKQVLLGHSMGGNLALNYLLRRHQITPRQDDLAGVALCAPMLLPPDPPPRPQIFAAWLTGHLLRRIRFRKPIDPTLLTGDEARARLLQNDPLSHCWISLYLATQLLSQGRWALDRARHVDVPTLIMHGERDELIDRSACEHAAIRIGRHARLVRWSGLRHDLFHESRRIEVTRKLADWLGQLVDRREPAMAA